MGNGRHAEHTEEVRQMVCKRLRSRSGQSLVEYLVMLTVIVVAVLAVQAAMKTHMKTLYEGAAAKVGTAAGAFGGFPSE